MGGRELNQGAGREAAPDEGKTQALPLPCYVTLAASCNLSEPRRPRGKWGGFTDTA